MILAGYKLHNGQIHILAPRSRLKFFVFLNIQSFSLRTNLKLSLIQLHVATPYSLLTTAGTIHSLSYRYVLRYLYDDTTVSIHI